MKNKVAQNRKRKLYGKAKKRKFKTGLPFKLADCNPPSMGYGEAVSIGLPLLLATRKTRGGIS